MPLKKLTIYIYIIVVYHFPLYIINHKELNGVHGKFITNPRKMLFLHNTNSKQHFSLERMCIHVAWTTLNFDFRDILISHPLSHL